MTDPTANIILDAFFQRSGGRVSSHPLVRHQIESFNDFIQRKIYQVIQGFHPVTIHAQYNPQHKDFEQKLHISFLNPTVSRPIYQKQDGSQQVMTPHMARLNNFTYASSLHVDLHLVSEVMNSDGVVVRDEKTIRGICIGKVPIMVRSAACILTQAPQLAVSADGHEVHEECRNDPGGYFIVHGNEKVVISQDRISENQTLIFPPNSASDGLTAEIRCVPDTTFTPPKTAALHMSGKSNHLGHVIRLNAHYIKTEIPLFVMFRALGIEADKDILQYILLDLDNPKNTRLQEALMATLEDGAEIHTQEEALTYLMRHVSISGTPREYLDQPDRMRKILLHMLKHDFLQQTAPCFQRKALYLGYMTRKLLKVHLRVQDYDNRDSYIHKRIDTPGILMANLFRQSFAKVIKEMRSAIQKEVNSWKPTSHTPSLVHLVHTANIHKFLKMNVIESGLRYALSTGNWGVKSVSSFGTVRQGVAQVLNRMSYLSMLSHLRRINTPMEKSGKLVQPRKLDNSQYGTICPAETPEGSSVGLVKNMAITTHITVATSSQYLRSKILEEPTAHILTDQPSLSETRAFLTEMGKPTSVVLFINGDLIGYTTNPTQVYQRLKKLKYQGTIAPTTSIAWNIQEGFINMSTEGGRMTRPLHIVDTDQGQLKCHSGGFGPLLHNMHFDDYLGGTTPEHQEGFLECLDVEELDHAMIAMQPKDLAKPPAQSYALPPRYTHCEIHPSTAYGVLAATIPFMNHNQSPRVTYQSAMGKQAVGIFATNFNQRYDTMTHLLHYAQRPMVQTQLSKSLHGDQMGAGVNCIVAIMTYSGFNQEDSVMVNKAALDRGLFCSTYFKTVRETCAKNHSTGEEEFFCMPDPNTTANMKPYNYDKLGPDGQIPKDTYVDQGDILVGKQMPTKINGKPQMRDTSLPMKPGEAGWVDRTYKGTNSDGYNFVKIRMREYRKPMVGDKLASKIAQKGTIGMIYEQQDMPFTKDGLVPDVIMNPHAIPSRMTIGQLIETLLGKAAALTGTTADASPFQEVDPTKIGDILAQHGYERHGNEVLYNGRTGQQIHTDIFIGPCYYQRLKHMVSDKQHCLSMDHEVLTKTGWKFHHQLTKEDLIATLKNNKLVYEKPLDILYFPDFAGKMYKIKNRNIDLNVTLNHRMWVSESGKEYDFKTADTLVGKPVFYKKDAEWDPPNINISMDDLLGDEIELGFKPCVWDINATQAKLFLKHLNIHKAPSKIVADQIMQLALHAGISADISEDNMITYNENSTPLANDDATEDEIYDFEGPVFCLQVPSEVFMVRRNGKAVWTGNSRGSNGPVILLTRQPAEGRARNGGLRFGEMERDAIISHGAATFLKERMMDVSDNYRVFTCRTCGMICTANPDKNIYKCGRCKNTADYAQVRIPYACKLLFQELECMGIAPRMRF